MQGYRLHLVLLSVPYPLPAAWHLPQPSKPVDRSDKENPRCRKLPSPTATRASSTKILSLSHASFSKKCSYYVVKNAHASSDRHAHPRRKEAAHALDHIPRTEENGAAFRKPLAEAGSPPFSTNPGSFPLNLSTSSFLRQVKSGMHLCEAPR